MGWQDAPLANTKASKSDSAPAWAAAPLAGKSDNYFPEGDSRNEPAAVTVGGGGKKADKSEPVASARQVLNKPNTGMVTGARGALQGFTFNLGDEILAGVNAVSGNGSTADTLGKRYENNLAYERNQFKADAAEHPVYDIAGNIIGSIAGPAKFIKGAKTLVGVAQEGAKLGAAYGFGAGEGGVPERVKSAEIGTMTGAGAGAAAKVVAPVAGRAINALIPRGAPAAGREIADAAARQNIELIPADVGGPGVRRLTAAAAQTPLGAGPVVRGAQRVVESIKGARDKLADQYGTVSDTIGAGEAAQKGSKAFIKRTGTVGNGLYTRAKALAGGAAVDPAGARSVIDGHLADLMETPNTNAGMIDVLNGLKQDLSKPLSIDAIRNLRTQTRDKLLEKGIRSSDADRRVSQVIDAASNDLTNALPPDAARAYRVADRYWRARVQTIDGVLTSVLGKDGEKSGQSAFEAIQRLGNDKGGDAEKLRRLVRALPSDEQEVVRGTLISRLGRANSGAQDATGEAFSPNTFLTHYSNMSPRAKDAVFGGKGTNLRDALEDLAVVTGGVKEASKYANSSQTGGVVATLATGGMLAGAMHQPVMAALALTGQYGAGRLMASPAYVRWLTRTVSSKTPAQFSKNVEALAPIAARYPAIADQVNNVISGLKASQNPDTASQNKARQTPQ